MPEVRVVNLTKTFGEIVAVKDVSFSIKDGEYVSIIGPSGCGKTTLIKCISGILRPDEGEIFIDDKLVNDLPIQDRGIGYVFQEIALFPHNKVYENVSYGPRVKGWEVEKTKNIVDEMINMLKLEDRVDAYPSEMSGGARQKTAIGRALASGSNLLLLDEPLGALDAKVREVLRFELRKLVKDLGLTAIHVTHDQEEAIGISDRIMIMKAGRVVEIAEPDELYLKPKRLFTAYFLGETNLLEGELIKTSRRGSTVQVKSHILKTVDRVDPKNKRVVASIRPEFVRILKSKKGLGDGQFWECNIKNIVFAGGTVRYEVQTEDGISVTVKRPSAYDEEILRVEDKIKIALPKNAINLYSYPEGGLEEEISLE